MDAFAPREPSRNRSFSDLAHRVLVAEKQAVLKDVAEQMGLTYASLYARLRGRVPFSAEQAAVLMRLVPDRRFVDYLLREAPFTAVPRLEDLSGRAADTLMDDALSALEHTVALVRSLDLSLRDSLLEDDEVEAVQGCIQQSERALATLRTRLERCARLGVAPCAPRARGD